MARRTSRCPDSTWRPRHVKSSRASSPGRRILLLRSDRVTLAISRLGRLFADGRSQIFLESLICSDSRCAGRCWSNRGVTHDILLCLEQRSAASLCWDLGGSSSGVPSRSLVLVARASGSLHLTLPRLHVATASRKMQTGQFAGEAHPVAPQR